MPEIKTEIIIDANMHTIWKALIDFKNYDKWNTFITRIDGDPVIGNSLSVTIAPPGLKSNTFNPTVTVINPNFEIRWVGKLLFEWIFRGEHYFLLEKINDNTTRLIHGERFTGIIASLLLYFIAKPTVAGFNNMNHSLHEHINKNLNNDNRNLINQYDLKKNIEVSHSPQHNKEYSLLHRIRHEKEAKVENHPVSPPSEANRYFCKMN